MNRRRQLISICTLAAIALILPPRFARATTFVRMDLRALVQAAQIIARVRCTGSETRIASGEIWTFDDFAVLETFKGNPSRVLRLRLPGGRVGHVETRIEGVPKFSSGEEAVLFIEKTSAGDYSITSWAQGTLRVHRSASGEDPRLTQDTSRNSVFDPATRQFTSVGIRELSLADFRRQIAEALHETSTNARESR